LINKFALLLSQQLWLCEWFQQNVVVDFKDELTGFISTDLNRAE